MRNRYNLAAVLSAVVLVCCAALILGQKVNAAGEGKITGTVKLDGTAPHMKGIDMSKDPYCVKAHANDPGHLETVVVGANGGLGERGSLHLRGWSGPAPGINRRAGIRSEKLHVYAARVGDGREPEIQGDHQRSDDSQHSPASQPDDRQYPVESVSAAGSAAGREELEGSGIYPSAVQHPSLDARLVRRGQRALRDHRRERQLHHQQRAARKLHRDGVAGSRRHAKRKK